MHFTNGTDVVPRILNSTSSSHIIDTESKNTLICTHWSVIYVKKNVNTANWVYGFGRREKKRSVLNTVAYLQIRSNKC